MKLAFFYSFLLFFSPLVLQENDGKYLSRQGTVNFTSEAPLEIINATSDQLKGVIDIQHKTFAFSVANNTFKGFNKPLQQEHFNENYMESHKFPKSSFQGKIIEDVDFSKDGEFTVRAKGILDIHGVKQERIMKSVMNIKNGVISVKANFTVLLKEHNIEIPKIVNQKIAEEIKVSVNTELVKQN